MRTKGWVFAVLSFAVAGCGSDPGQPSGPCPTPAGSFRMTWVEESGSCGPVPDQVINVGGTSTSSCTGPQTISADKCRITSDITCQTTPGYDVKSAGVVDWSPTGNSATGTVQVTLIPTATGIPQCTSVYGVTYTRI